jgi:two-component system cell cycle sensor histidine kinase/response regulator CckA
MMAQPHSEHSGPPTVLLVEDQASVRMFVRKALEYGGYEVLEANSGFEALAVLAKNPEAIDLVLTDIVMPGGMSGRLMADTVANRYPATKVVFMSGNAELVRVLNGGSTEGPTLEKPFTSFMLLERVRLALENPISAPMEATTYL